VQQLTVQVLDHVLELTQDHGLGILLEGDAKSLLDKGAEIKHSKDAKELR
jgi:LETM1 and EF-hand domain-containing protein 1